ncbi:hypothetical protein CR203_14640 [Salipaludibacillus neizhouensis]|uniref:Uncharacterized protein n=1 Tax=Salipaludibacillus neizhouensis TaxID=885475 RepID=A0A3A9K6N6_9BACI|nr:hypothetical protein [Salipaludibacillus neizhouensis]RKL66530.1 hypothetical protein CR203_14640 [Salipaludibacillus neizhouensis]
MEKKNKYSVCPPSIIRREKDYLIVLSTLFLLTRYLTLWPVPINPSYWEAPQAEGYTGPHKVNNGLAGMEVIELDHYKQPEHIVYRDNWLYAATKDGEITRVRPDGSDSNQQNCIIPNLIEQNSSSCVQR